MTELHALNGDERDLDELALEAALAAEEAIPSGQQFTVERGIFRYELGSPHYVSLEFDQLRTERDGGMSAEVTARSTAPGMGKLIHLARTTITGTRSRQDLASHLAKRHPGPKIDWPELVEQATVQTVQAYRAGEPSILLRDAVEPLDSGYLIKPLLVARQPTIWFGDGGNGKSFLALAAALTIHGDRADLLGIHPAAQLRVAYCDWEFDAWEHRKRMRSLIGAAEPEPDLVYVRCFGPLREQVDRLRKVIREQDIDYLVIDSVAAACGGEPESAEVALGFFDSIRRLGVGALCIAHTTKNPEAQERPFGSTFWHNMARSTWLVRKEQQAGDSGLSVGMFHKKANSGPLSPPLGFQIAFGDGRTTIRRTDVRDVPGLAEHVSTSSRIRHAIKGGPKSYAELAEELEVGKDAVRKAAERGARGTGPFVLVGDARGQRVALRM